MCLKYVTNVSFHIDPHSPFTMTHPPNVLHRMQLRNCRRTNSEANLLRQTKSTSLPWTIMYTETVCIFYSDNKRGNVVGLSLYLNSDITMRQAFENTCSICSLSNYRPVNTYSVSRWPNKLVTAWNSCDCNYANKSRSMVVGKLNNGME
jgi:hypothetical protein